MKSTIKKFFLMQSLIILSAACSSLASPLPPKLELRTLRISKDKPSLEYRYEECEKKFLILKECKMVTEFYDLSDPAVRSRLINMGFVVKVRVKP